MHSFMIWCLMTTLLAAAYGYYHEDHEPAHYKFAYGISDHHTGDHHQQHEVRDGHVVKGSYSLKEADGTIRVVEYVAGPHSGFNAVVKRIGHAHHPQHYKTYDGQNNEGKQGGFDESSVYGSQSYGYGNGKAESYVGTTHWGYNY